MRLKFFVTIFIVLIVTAISISAIHFHFFRLERLRLIELNLQQNVTLILDSDLTLTKKDFQQKGVNYIEEVIGNDKVNMIVAIYNKNGNLLYRNDNAEIFDTPTRISGKFKEWEDVESKDYLIKYLTVFDESGNKIIRVGMILNQSLLRWKYLSQRVMIFGVIILLIVTIISYFLTLLLFRPVQDLAKHINVMTEKLDSGETNDFNSILQISTNRFNDEFGILLKAIESLSKKIHESHNITKKWSAMMAHELKTPLTILKNRIESLTQDESSSPSKILAVDEEMNRLEKIIGNFLDWASFESDPARPEIHAISLKKRSEYVLGNLKDAFPGIQMEFSFQGQDDLRIFCDPIHFDQLLMNLITNAFKYGKGVTKIECSGNLLCVSDEGEGIPLEVLEKLGSPFNHFKQGNSKGFGLGLAWVTTICKKYGWKLLIDKNTRNKIVIDFATEPS